jgi:hypothetical protein
MKKLLMCVSHAYLSAALSPLVVRTIGSGDCNLESAASFDSSQHPLFFLGGSCMSVCAALLLSGGSCD